MDMPRELRKAIAVKSPGERPEAQIFPSLPLSVGLSHGIQTICLGCTSHPSGGSEWPEEPRAREKRMQCEAMSGRVASSAAVAGDAARRHALPVSALGGYQGGGCSPSSGLSFSYTLPY